MSRKNELKAIIAYYGQYTFYHAVENGELGPATNLTHESIKSIFKSTVKGVKEKIIFMKWKSFIPENVLHFDILNNSIIFYTKPTFKKLLFAKHTNIPSAEYKIPFLLWKYKNRQLDVYALKKKPTSEKDILYHAPFMNINSRGNVS